jgi:hypothetical protein
LTDRDLGAPRSREEAEGVGEAQPEVRDLGQVALGEQPPSFLRRDAVAVQERRVRLLELGREVL